MGLMFCMCRVLNAFASIKLRKVWFDDVFLVVRHKQPHIFTSLDKIKSSFVTVITGKQIRVFDLTTYGIL